MTVVLEAIGVKLGEMLVKCACEAITGSKLAGDMSGAVTALLGQQGMDALGRRRALRHMEERADQIARKVLARYGTEFRALSEEQRTVVIGAVASTFEYTPPAAGLVLGADFAVDRVEKAVRSTTAGFRKSWTFDDSEDELYSLVLRESCADLVKIVRGMPTLASVATPEILARLTKITADVGTAPARALAEADRDRDARFAEIYRQHVTSELDVVELAGEQLSETSRRYPLDPAYLSLPAMIHSAGSSEEARIERALAGRSRVILRAECGGGKTTYLSRLFSLVARRNLPAHLRELAATVPFYIPLHRYAESDPPMPEKFLDWVARTVAGEMPQGWVQRQLREGESLVLLNGLDEVPAARRPIVLEWVSKLVKQFPRPRYVLASRPAAIPEEWPASAGFDVVDLLPMSPSDVRTFIRRWHDAVGTTLSDPAALAEVEQCAATMTESLGRSHALRVLSRNPLLCALMCALNWDKRVHLPGQWLDLLKIVVEILVGERDAVRDVVDELELPREQRMRALQNIAFWMVTEDLPGGEFDEVLARVEYLFAGPGPECADAKTTLEHLTVRSGLMYADRDGLLRFTSPILRDYLAAREAVDGGNIRFLLREAHLPERHPLIVMAAGYASMMRAEELLTGLLTRAADQPADRDKLLVLAHACLAAIPALGEDLRERVRHESAELLAPRTDAAADALAKGSPFVFDLVHTGQEHDLEVVTALIRAAARAGECSILPVLSQFAGDPRSTVQELLFSAWPSFDPVQYAHVVVACCPQSSDPVTVDATVLPGVTCVPWMRQVRISEQGCDGEIDLTPLAGIQHMTVYVPSGVSLRGEDALGKGSRVVVGGESRG